MLSRSESVLLFRMTEIDIVMIRVDMKFGGRLGVYFIAVFPESGFQRLLQFSSKRGIYRIHTPRERSTH